MTNQRKVGERWSDSHLMQTRDGAVWQESRTLERLFPINEETNPHADPTSLNARNPNVTAGHQSPPRLNEASKCFQSDLDMGFESQLGPNKQLQHHKSRPIITTTNVSTQCDLPINTYTLAHAQTVDRGGNQSSSKSTEEDDKVGTLLDHISDTMTENDRKAGHSKREESRLKERTLRLDVNPRRKSDFRSGHIQSSSIQAKTNTSTRTNEEVPSRGEVGSLRGSRSSVLSSTS